MSYHLVNYHQTKEERRDKYWLLRSIGINVSWARKGRDLRMSTIERFYGDRLGITKASTSSQPQT